MGSWLLPHLLDKMELFLNVGQTQAQAGICRRVDVGTQRRKGWIKCVEGQERCRYGILVTFSLGGFSYSLFGRYGGDICLGEDVGEGRFSLGFRSVRKASLCSAYLHSNSWHSPIGKSVSVIRR